MIDAADVFKASDFSSLKLHVALSNNTTHTEVKDKSKLSLLEIGEKSLVLEVPLNSCNVKHMLLIEISQPEKGSKKNKPLLVATGKVLEREDLNDGMARITVDCVQFDEKSWKDLINIYSSRQKDIEEFFKAVKG